ncbi:MAG: hypothetical protein QOI48_1949 [Solirubrobacteraceae bacterium]|jgi:RNA polymerase sigma factor (sigma-70 family)|nr:hypothetical protein [Solirubrobacteraceae bacterium]
MTTNCDSRPTTSDPIGAHRYVLPNVREITPAAATSRHKTPARRTLETDRQATAAQRRTTARELERVVTAASEGDPSALSELVERFGPRVRDIARVHRLGAHDVEDVTQTTWLRLLENVNTIRDPNAIGAWLVTTARRESLRIINGTRRERPTDDQLLLDAPAPPVDEEPLLTPERRAALSAALKQLTAHQRQLLSMLFADPAPSYAEISRALGMPIGSIGPTRARSLARLREDQGIRDVTEERPLSTLHDTIAWRRTSVSDALAA